MQKKIITMRITKQKLNKDVTRIRCTPGADGDKQQLQHPDMSRTKQNY